MTELSTEASKAFNELKRLACPVCHQKLSAEDNAVVCMGCARRYPVIDGIPVLLADCAL